MAIEICEMSPRHLDGVAEIEKQCFSLPWSRAMLEEELGRDFAVYLVALVDGEPCAYAGAHVAADEVCINNVATLPAHRRGGLAELTLRELMRESYVRGGRRFSLEVRKSNAPARALYEKLGFTEAGIRKMYYSNPAEDAIIMIKETV